MGPDSARLSPDSHNNPRLPGREDAAKLAEKAELDAINETARIAREAADAIAEQILGITRHELSMIPHEDMYTRHVRSIKQALVSAFNAGVNHEKGKRVC